MLIHEYFITVREDRSDNLFTVCFHVIDLFFLSFILLFSSV